MFHRSVRISPNHSALHPCNRYEYFKINLLTLHCASVKLKSEIKFRYVARIKTEVVVPCRQVLFYTEILLDNYHCLSVDLIHPIELGLLERPHPDHCTPK
jgi:hypothetical protein